MQRLIEHANSLKEANGEMADLSIDSFANIVEAIHLVQVEMGISGISAEEAAEKVASGAMTQEEAFAAMGTTAKEASSTIQGSVSSMAAAWNNLIVGVANDEADFDSLIDGFVNSVSTAADNIIPRIRIALEGASKLIDELLPIIVEKVPQIISENLPIIVESGAKIVKSFVSGIADNKDSLIPVVTGAMVTIGKTAIELLPDMISIGVEIVISLVKGIAESLPELIPVTIDAIMQIVETLTNPDSILELVNAALKIVMALAQGLIDALPGLLERIPEIINGVVGALLEAIPQIMATGVILLTALTENVDEIVDGIVDAIPEIIEGTIDALLNHLPDFAMAGIELFVALLRARVTIIFKLISAIPEIISSVIGAILNEKNLKAMSNAGVKLVEALWDGLKEITGWLWEKVSGAIGSLIEKISGLFGIPVSAITSVAGQIGSGISSTVSKATSALGLDEAAESVSSWISDKISGFKEWASTPAWTGGGGANRHNRTFDDYSETGMTVEDLAGFGRKSASEASDAGTRTNTVIINAPSIDRATVEYIMDEVNNGLGALS